MADNADRALEDAEVISEAEIALIRERASNIPKGIPGLCRSCGEHFERLVGGHCGWCRDWLKLP